MEARVAMNGTCLTSRTWFGRSETGATMLQFVLAFPVFMMFVVVIIDYGRVTALGNVVREGMAAGMQKAISVPNLDIEPRGKTTADYHYQRSKIAREMVEQTALGVITGIHSMGVGDDASQASATGPKLFDIVLTENRISDGPDVQTYKVAALMPGECVEVPAIGHIECNRETLGTTPADPFPLQRPEFLLKKHPVKVVAFAQFDAFTPWLFSRAQKFEQYAYRPHIPQVPFPTSIDPQPYEELQEAMKPEVHLPRGKVRIKQPEPYSCTVNWDVCVQKSLSDGGPRCPCNEVDETDPPTCTCKKVCCGPR